uniref:Uncharacterized protein n=1 Tax=Trypanosoma vivax (strain Y486) TaxID=1055687 RepID=G0TYI7_TRYVY|nr:hypothetical protein, unlikely [Trypanosoma vivax Y486]
MGECTYVGGKGNTNGKKCVCANSRWRITYRSKVHRNLPSPAPQILQKILEGQWKYERGLVDIQVQRRKEIEKEGPNPLHSITRPTPTVSTSSLFLGSSSPSSSPRLMLFSFYNYSQPPLLKHSSIACPQPPTPQRHARKQCNCKEEKGKKWVNKIIVVVVVIIIKESK